MATLLKRKSKKTGKMLYTVQFTLGRRRPCVPLGSLTKAQAGEVKGHIERLVGARRSNAALDGTTAAWLADVNDNFHMRLVEVGLLESRQAIGTEPLARPDTPILGSFLDSYIAKRSDVKFGTSVVYGHTRRCLVEFFGAEKRLADITPGDADDWRRWLGRTKNESKPQLGGQGLSDNTVRRRCGIARQFFRDAVRRRLIGESPFAEM